MTDKTVTCILCEKIVSPDDVGRSFKPKYFDDVVICPACLEAERMGHGENAASVQRQLARRKPGPAPATDSTKPA